MFTKKSSKLEGNFEFKNFQEALDFVNIIGKLAEEYDHHPDILIHQYKKVRIILITHTEDKITQKDYDMSVEIEEVYKK